jgi:hypothetical protein
VRTKLTCGLRGGFPTTRGETGAAPSLHRCAGRRSTAFGPKLVRTQRLGATTSSGTCAGCGTTPVMTPRRLARSEGACAGLRGDGPGRQSRNRRRCSYALPAPQPHHNRTRLSGEQRGTTVKAAEADRAEPRLFAQVSAQTSRNDRSFPSDVVQPSHQWPSTSSRDPEM